MIEIRDVTVIKKIHTMEYKKTESCAFEGEREYQDLNSERGKPKNPNAIVNRCITHWHHHHHSTFTDFTSKHCETLGNRIEESGVGQR